MTRAGLSKRSEGLVSHKKSPHQSQDRKKWRIKGGEWKQTAITTTTEKRASWKLRSGLFHSIPYPQQRSTVELKLFQYGRGCQIALPLDSHCHSALGQKKLLDGKRSFGPTNHLPAPPRKCLNIISLLSHCSSLLCLFNTMFICCLYAPVQSSDCSEGYSCPSVHVRWKMSLFFRTILLTLIFFSLKCVPSFQPSSQDFQGHNWDSGWRERVFPQIMF